MLQFEIRGDLKVKPNVTGSISDPGTGTTFKNVKNF